MYDTAKCVELVKMRARKLQRRRERRRVSALSALCVILFTSLAGTIALAVSPVDLIARGMYGTMLLRENVGGYVLVGVIAFVAAVVITLLCIRYRERSRKNGKSDTREEDEP